MNFLKSRAMNCGPLSEMIRGLASGYFSLARYLDGYSRFIVHWDLRESMREADIEIICRPAEFAAALKKVKQVGPGSRQRVPLGQRRGDHRRRGPVRTSQLQNRVGTTPACDAVPPNRRQVLTREGAHNPPQKG